MRCLISSKLSACLPEGAASWVFHGRSKGVGSPIRLASSNSHTHTHTILLMVQKSYWNRLRLVVYPRYLQVFFCLNIPAGAPSTKTVSSSPHSWMCGLVDLKTLSGQSKMPENIWMFPKIGGTPKSSILIGFSIININHPFWGTSNFGNTHINYIKWYVKG